MKKDCDTKRMLFEMMGKLNPDSIMLNEIVDASTTPVVGGNIKSADKKIDTPMEFSQAFILWFQSLGYDTQNKTISTSKVLTDVRNAMQQLGYK